jgi:hypothetical protein
MCAKKYIFRARPREGPGEGGGPRCGRAPPGGAARTAKARAHTLTQISRAVPVCLHVRRREELHTIRLSTLYSPLRSTRMAKVTICPPLEAHVLSGLFALPALILALLPFRVVHVHAIIVCCARVLVGEHLW